MSDEKPLKLVILYEAGRNLYSVSEHNQSPDEAEQLVRDYNRHLKPGFSLIAIDQKKPHKGNAEGCRACRQAVKQSSGLKPSPTFKRRIQPAAEEPAASSAEADEEGTSPEGS